MFVLQKLQWRRHTGWCHWAYGLWAPHWGGPAWSSTDSPTHSQNKLIFPSRPGQCKGCLFSALNITAKQVFTHSHYSSKENELHKEALGILIRLPRSGFPSSCFETVITTGSNAKGVGETGAFAFDSQVGSVDPSAIWTGRRDQRRKPPTLADYPRSVLYLHLCNRALHYSSQGCCCLQLKTSSIIFPQFSEPCVLPYGWALKPDLQILSVGKRHEWPRAYILPDSLTLFLSHTHSCWQLCSSSTQRSVIYSSFPPATQALSSTESCNRNVSRIWLAGKQLAQKTQVRNTQIRQLAKTTLCRVVCSLYMLKGNLCSKLSDLFYCKQLQTLLSPG